MSDKGNVFQKGGGGTNFEQLVQSAFIITLMVRGNVPCLDSAKLTEVAFQVTNRGYETDDLMVVAKSKLGDHKVLVQVKHNISFTSDNEMFKEVMSAFWKDYNNTRLFDKTRDKLVVIKSGMTLDEKNHLKTLFNWSTTHASETDFVSEVNRIKGKKKRLDVFRDVLTELNGNNALSDKELWSFLKCVDVLEYDFLNSGSVDKAYFLNLIKLARIKESNSSESEIWDSIVAFTGTLNPNGGSVTLESIKDKSFFNHFDTAQLSPYARALEKLISDGREILRPFKTSLGTGLDQFQLSRVEIEERVLKALSENRITVVTGEPGVGKSALIKEILQKDFKNSSVFVFRADQFNEPTLAKVFSSHGVEGTAYDIFSQLALITERIIFIDSLEKLLEADPECAFTQLLALLKEHPEVKVIASSRKYAVDLLMLKFGIRKGTTRVIDVPTLNKGELKLVSEKFPELKDVLENDKLEKLLRRPKYLDFSIQALSKSEENYTNVSLTEFKDMLWNSLVADYTNRRNGLPIKREKAFGEIAVKRAKEMKLFIRVDQLDAEAIACLENDGIVFQENNNRRYSPTHDILEDWALVKYVSSVFEEYPRPKDLFMHLGNEPAIRRAFRLWIEDFLIDKIDRINELVRATFFDESVEKYWSDELLIAIFKSDNSHAFFVSFENELIAQNATFLNRCLHLIKTCCKESNEVSNGDLLLLPIGSGWKEAILFVQRHISHLVEIKLSIRNFLADWHSRLLFQEGKIEKKELEAAKYIVLIYLKEVEKGNKFWQEKYVKGKELIFIDLLFDLASISREDIQNLVSRALKRKEDDISWNLDSFYEKVIEKCLSGIGNSNLLKELPDLIVETAWSTWMSIPRKEAGSSGDTAEILASYSLRNEECWGVKDNISFFPSGIYKTPFYNLLYVNPIVGLKFIIDFINYSVDFYVKAKCQYKHSISQLEIEQNNGDQRKVFASAELWFAFRGLSVTHYVLESLLMSLEKFLLEKAKRKSKVSRENVKFVYDYIFKNSNNVAPIAVLSSVAIAHPEEVEDAMMPLLSIREFYQWDLSRALQERSALSPLDEGIPFAQKERWESNQLPHRKKYYRGLRDFVLDYQFNVRKLNKEIHQRIDMLKAQYQGDDVVWKKNLIEMDIRNHKVGEYDEELGGFPIQPNYDQEVVGFMESQKESAKADSVSLDYASKLSASYTHNELMDFSFWLTCFEEYSSKESFNIIHDRPITMAVLGLRDFYSMLSESQRNKCADFIIEGVNSTLRQTYTRDYSLDLNISLMEKEIALTSFHLLMKSMESEENKNEIIAIMIYILYAPFDDHEMGYIAKYIREEFFEQFPEEAKRVWCGFIRYSIFRKVNSGFQEGDDLGEFKAKEAEFIKEVSTNKNIALPRAELRIENCNGYLLARAFVLIPYDLNDDDYEVFIIQVLPMVLEDLKKEEDYSFTRTKDVRQFDHRSISNISKYLAGLFLEAEFVFSKSVLLMLVSALSNVERKKRYGRDELLEFVNGVLDFTVLKLYDNRNSEREKHDEQKVNFWSLWEVLFSLIPNGDDHPLIKKLLLDIRYLLWDYQGKPSENNWIVLRGKKEFYKRAFLEKGRDHTASVINVFSTVGGKEFLPEGISWLVDVYKSNPIQTLTLTLTSAERMIKELFYNNISRIKNDRTLINDYVWILNKMIDFGSSEAYLFRENVISYKKSES